MAGRPKKPTALKLVEGNRGKRAINGGEPDPAYLVDLTAPEHLPESARKVWDELAPRLRAARVLTEMDVPALEMTCVAIATHRNATAQAHGEPLTEHPQNGTMNLNPWMIVQSMAFKQAMLGLGRFGMTPQDRARVVINPQAGLFDDQGASRFFK